MSHFCYLIFNQENQTTYNGYTNNLQRRLRQHNQEIKGGAKATRKSKTWKYLAVISCEQFTKHTALSMEWHIRYPTCKKPRPREYCCPKGRLESLNLVFGHEKFRDMSFELWISEPYQNVQVDFADNVTLVETVLE